MSKRKYWSKQDIEYLKVHINDMSINELAFHFNVSYQAITHKLSKLNIPKKSYGTYWTDKENSIIHEHFEYAPKEYLMNLLPNRTWVAIVQHGNDCGLNRKTQDRYTINYRYFSSWNENVAYILGLIAADGHIIYHGNSNSNSLELELAEYDVEILYKILDILESKKPLMYSKKKHTYKLSISNVKIIEDMIQKGIPYINKTTDICFPSDIPHEFQKDFIRGILDGDGSIYIEKATNRLHLQFLGSLSMITSIRDIIPIDITDLTIIDLYSSHACYKLSISGKRAQQILSWIYNDSTLYFQRKHNIYLSYLSSQTSPCIQ